MVCNCKFDFMVCYYKLNFMVCNLKLDYCMYKPVAVIYEYIISA